ncbi:Pyruvate/2-oxoacid:ferredoxin oxidoreductase delta subunit [Spinactinospora alkalitolerans]|uniref:Pyruvate/2-oxoacid:ferredoxin oxidoreductase delta subunit n=1 Tax=Spinactinospora alkalitolerans TaxID=687207 RepID=A0A852TTV0_9ACTN|nr:4Fe-4S dicluster domain-containing protein [Spinactinospora alkalitolerans]NYE46282.1 Pyruvate/2-oxoacid:ferredoxin oxidoreductase delta subunit [Spinactinospora alkalitolerans]
MSELTAAPVAVTSACTACGACLLTCPEHAIRPAHRAGGAGEPVLDVLADRCTGCLECVEICPADAIAEVSGDVRVHDHAGGVRT